MLVFSLILIVSDPYSFHDLTFFYDVLKIVLKFSDLKNLANLKLATLWWGAARILYGFANLDSNNDCSNHSRFRDLMFPKIFCGFLTIFQKFTTINISNPLVGCCLPFFRRCKSCPQLCILKGFDFLRSDVFMICFKVFKRFAFENLSKLQISNPLVGWC